MNKDEKKVLRALISKYNLSDVIHETVNVASGSSHVRSIATVILFNENGGGGERHITATCDKFKQEALKEKALARKVHSEINALEGVLRSLRGEK